MSKIIDMIMSDLDWLNDNKSANNIHNISKVLNHLSLLSVNLGMEVSDAYALMNECEDEYNGQFATFVRDFEGSVAKGELAAEAKLVDLKKDWTTAKNGYKKLSTFLDRLDKVLDAHRQSLSITKLELKGV